MNIILINSMIIGFIEKSISNFIKIYRMFYKFIIINFFW